ncbi:MAG TPA: choice-of-anchor D domain-containing protein [Polyangiaceae bacterium]|nr:choice-of-anchor D domain-containing protein [Polyangiaceae bacterium]
MLKFSKLRWAKIFTAALAALLLAGSCSEAYLRSEPSGLVDFGWHTVGTSATRTVTITNTGDADAVLRTVSFSATFGSGHASSPPLVLEATSCRAGDTLPANGGTCTFTVRFSPVEGGGAMATLEVSYYWTNAAWDRTLRLYFNAFANNALTISDYPSFDYGGLSLTSSATKVFDVKNWFDQDVTLGAVTAESLGLSAPFSLTGGSCTSGLTLANRASCTLDVKFTPTLFGPAHDNIDLSYRIAGSSADAIASRPVSGAGTRADPVRSIATGWNHTCATLTSGHVRCWGIGKDGSLGYGNTRNVGDNEFPTTVGNVRIGAAVDSVAIGWGHSCARLRDGGLRCWGGNESGELGYGHKRSIGDDELPYTAGDVKIGGNVVQVAAGRYHSCALLSGGSVRCFGSNDNGQLGYGHTRNIGDDELPNVATVDVGGPVRQLAAGGSHTCALLFNGAVRCWGNGVGGRLGYGNVDTIGDDEAPSVAGDVNLGGKAIQVAAGWFHSCALLDTGSIRCWGVNTDGELGYGNTQHVGDDELPSAAGDVNVGGAVSQLSIGERHTCALLTTGKVRCWGYNEYGWLGYGHTQAIGDDESPASAGDVPLPAGAAQVSAGWVHSCALLTTGGVHCWGWPGDGLLGNAQPTDYPNTPASTAADVPVQ